MCSHILAPGAAVFLLNWPTTDVNITIQSGVSFLARVRGAVKQLGFSNRVQDQLLLQQWRTLERMLVERGAADTAGIVDDGFRLRIG
jgi:hypothetical protein